jgi:hypothetical protein
VHDGVQQLDESVAVLRVEPIRRGCECVSDLDGHLLRQLMAGAGEEHVDDAAVLGVFAPGHQPSAFGTVDEARQGRFVQAEERGELGHARAAVAEDAQNPQLGE